MYLLMVWNLGATFGAPKRPRDIYITLPYVAPGVRCIRLFGKSIRSVAQRQKLDLLGLEQA